MRKIITFFVIMMIISFLTPNLFLIDVMNLEMIKNERDISGDKDRKLGANENKTMITNEISLRVPEKIKLLLTEKNEIIELNFDEYIKGVLIGEVPITYELEALKAQAIVARTYTLYKLKNNPTSHGEANMCDDINCCQCYKTKEYAFASWDDKEENEKWTKLETAVNSTKNMCITYSGEIISAFFHANSGGKTENVKYVWGEEEIPYLKSVDGNEQDTYQDSKSFTKQEFAELIKEHVNDYAEKNYEIEILDYTGSGRINNLKVGNAKFKATELRKVLGLRSTNFRVEKNESGDITFFTIGYGHGVGMSQEGANQMAKSGKKVEDIIKHYYTGVEISSY